MVLSAEQKCLLWLSAAEITAGRVQQLLSVYHSPEEIWESFGKSSGPKFQDFAQQTLEKLHSRAAIDDLIERLVRKSVQLLFETDDAYPEALRAIQDPPYLLYYAGRLSALQKPLVAIVGTRTPSGYGCEMAAMLARGLCEAGVTVVSGLARGIDGAAHKAALAANGCTVGVLGSGINVPYPLEHRPLLQTIASGSGLIFSEYPLDAGPVPFHFPHRNRIISGLSLGTVFVEGRIKSGGMHTVNAALMQGRDVFAVPGRVGSVGSEGPHAILREGARIVTSARDVLEDLGLVEITMEQKPPKRSKPKLTPLQTAIVRQLEMEALTADELCARVQAHPDEIITELGTMEILGHINRDAGNRFSLPISTHH